jgi:hypothetical protein
VDWPPFVGSQLAYCTGITRPPVAPTPRSGPRLGLTRISLPCFTFLAWPTHEAGPPVFPVRRASQILFTGTILVIDSSIAQYHQRLAVLSRSHPLRIFALLVLAMMQYKRHMLSGQSEDLDESILRFAESICLPPRLWSEHGPLILQSLFLLASSLLKRSQLSHQDQDAIFSAKYLRYLLNQPFNVPRVPRHRVITMLVEALKVQIKLQAGNVTQSVEEITLLRNELLTPDVPDVGPATRTDSHLTAPLSVPSMADADKQAGKSPSLSSSSPVSTIVHRVSPRNRFLDHTISSTSRSIISNSPPSTFYSSFSSYDAIPATHVVKSKRRPQ